MKNQISQIKRVAVPVLKHNQVKKAGIFGSVARGEDRKTSDIDFVIEFEGRKSLLDLVSLKRELEQSLLKPVDIITYKSLHPLLRKRVMHDEVRIL